MINAPATAAIPPDLALLQAMMCLLMAKLFTASRINGPCMRAPIRRLMMVYSPKVQARFTQMAKPLLELVIPFLAALKRLMAVKLFLRGKSCAE